MAGGESRVTSHRENPSFQKIDYWHYLTPDPHQQIFSSNLSQARILATSGDFSIIYVRKLFTIFSQVGIQSRCAGVHSSGGRSMSICLGKQKQQPGLSTS